MLYNPSFFGRIRNDVMGVALNWIEATQGVRGEYNLETLLAWRRGKSDRSLECRTDTGKCRVGGSFPKTITQELEPAFIRAISQ